MRRMGSIAVGLLAALSFLSPAARADEANWPQWRGPLGSGFAPGASPPLEWSETKNVQWKVEVPGSGSSTPIVWKNQIFLQTAIPTGKKTPAPAGEAADGPATDDRGSQKDAPEKNVADKGAADKDNAADPAVPSDGRSGPPRRGNGDARPRRRPGRGGPRTEEPAEEHQFVVLAIDLKTGQTLWKQIACHQTPHEGHHADNNYAAHSPVTDGTCVCAYFGSRGLYCYDLAGKLKWQKDLGKQETRNGFGEGSSPALFGGVVVINWDHEGDDFIAAFDKDTGRELWRQPRDEHTSWATPLVVEHAGRAQVITAATAKIRSYDLLSGQQLWECAGLTPNAIPSPVAAGDILYVTSGFRGNALLAIRLGRTGDLTGTDAIVWSHNKNTPYVPSPLLSGDRLYFYSGNKAILSCFDVKTGQALFGPKRLEGLGNVYASPVGVAGRVYLAGRDGATVVIKDADELEVLATNHLDDGFDASPAVVDNRLLLRGKMHLYLLSEQ